MRQNLAEHIAKIDPDEVLVSKHVRRVGATVTITVSCTMPDGDRMSETMQIPADQVVPGSRLYQGIKPTWSPNAKTVSFKTFRSAR